MIVYEYDGQVKIKKEEGRGIHCQLYSAIILKIVIKNSTSLQNNL